MEAAGTARQRVSVLRLRQHRAIDQLTNVLLILRVTVTFGNKDRAADEPLILMSIKLLKRQC